MKFRSIWKRQFDHIQELYRHTQFGVRIYNFITQGFLALSATTAISAITITLIDASATWGNITQQISSVCSLAYFCLRLLSYHLYQCVQMQVYETNIRLRLSEIQTALINPDEIDETEMVANGLAIYAFHYNEGLKTFEKSFFNYAYIRQLRQITSITSAILIAILVTCSWLVSLDKIMVGTLLMATMLLVFQLLRQFLLEKRLEHINYSFERFFIWHKSTNNLFYLQQNKIEYEKVMCWAVTSFPQCITNKMNPQLMVKWAEEKIRLNIS